MILAEIYKGMKDIAVGVLDGDDEAIALSDKLSKKEDHTYGAVYDKNHRLYYGFESFGLSEEKTISAAFYKYKRHCTSNKFASMGSSSFKHRFKILNKEEYEKLRNDKGTLFKKLT
jgi:hypothetical protein